MFEKENVKLFRKGHIESCKLKLGQLKSLCGAENCLNVIPEDHETYTSAMRIYPRKIMFKHSHYSCNSWLVFNVVSRQ